MGKYKLINTETNEETLCDKLTIDGFDFYITNQLPKIGDFVYNGKSKEIYKITIKELIVDYEFPIICTTAPNNLPQVVDEVEVLAESTYGTEVESYRGRTPYDLQNDRKTGFIRGYNKAQEKFGNSDEDMVEFGDWIRNNPYVWNYPYKLNYKRTTQELLELWKQQQQPKKIYYK